MTVQEQVPLESCAYAAACEQLDKERTSSQITLCGREACGLTVLLATSRSSELIPSSKDKEGVPLYCAFGKAVREAMTFDVASPDQALAL